MSQWCLHSTFSAAQLQKCCQLSAPPLGVSNESVLQRLRSNVKKIRKENSVKDFVQSRCLKMHPEKSEAQDLFHPPVVGWSGVWRLSPCHQRRSCHDFNSVLEQCSPSLLICFGMSWPTAFSPHVERSFIWAGPVQQHFPVTKQLIPFDERDEWDASSCLQCGKTQETQTTK